MNTPLVEISHVSKSFPIRSGGGGRRRGRLLALDDVSFDIPRGQTVGVVGESGAGKSTLARLVALLSVPDRGTIRYDGVDPQSASREELRRVRAKLGVVFQNPRASFNPRRTLLRSLCEPLEVQRFGDPAARRHRALTEIKEVGLDESLADRFPYSLSGGQLQRFGLARALITEPDLIILDEPTASLDVSVRAALVERLLDIQRRRGLSYLLISHDLWVVSVMADQIVVLRDGKVVEAGPKQGLLTSPREKYTRELFSYASDPLPNARGRDRRVGAA